MQTSRVSVFLRTLILHQSYPGMTVVICNILHQSGLLWVSTVFLLFTHSQSLMSTLKLTASKVFYDVLNASCVDYYKMSVLVKLGCCGTVTATSTTLSPKIATFRSRRSIICAAVLSLLSITVSSTASHGWRCRELAAASTNWTGPTCHSYSARYLWTVA